MSTEPENVVDDVVDEAPEFEEVPMDPTTRDTIKRQWADELWSRGMPYRGRP